MSDNRSTMPYRRTLLKTLGTFALVTPFVQLISCGSGGDETVKDTASAADSGTETSGSWLSGGTVNMTVDFPDDSLFASAAACGVSLTGQQTEGPCYFSTDYLDDISEDQTGLPMQLCLA